jgi:hypothetical protein
MPTRSEVVDALIKATTAAVPQLFREHQGEHFYYCSLITTGEALSPNLCAWSTEALDVAARQWPDPNAREDIKWSYADSPYFCYGEEHFGEVRRLFEALGVPSPWDDDAREAAQAFKMSAMEEAMARVERSGVFGSGSQRAGIVVNVEVMPPDYTNVERALRLNPPEALSDWLKEAAEKRN